MYALSRLYPLTQPNQPCTDTTVCLTKSQTQVYGKQGGQLGHKSPSPLGRHARNTARVTAQVQPGHCKLSKRKPRRPAWYQSPSPLGRHARNTASMTAQVQPGHCKLSKRKPRRPAWSQKPLPSGPTRAQHRAHDSPGAAGCRSYFAEEASLVTKAPPLWADTRATPHA